MICPPSNCVLGWAASRLHVLSRSQAGGELYRLKSRNGRLLEEGLGYGLQSDENP